MSEHLDEISQTAHENHLFRLAMHADSREDRDRFLRTACGKDEELFHRFRDFLNLGRSVRHASDMGELTTASLSHQREIELASSFQDDATGKYRVVELIGEGGSSLVYRSESQIDPSHEVAIKLLKPGMETREAIGRLRTEASILFKLRHPNIARIFDMGVTTIGFPFLVLEYVRGEQIHEYCKRTSLPLEKRLRLFLQICSAIQHAHQNGLIHRDIKPSNILVEEIDGNPFARVLDFGIAKVLDSEPTKSSFTSTHTGQLIGTLEYLSPEQASLGKMLIDTRTDIYGAACVLYELLMGQSPLAHRLNAAKSLADAIQIILNDWPVSPGNRLIEEYRLSRGRSGELGAVIMKALDKDAERRYSSIQEFAQDITSWLENLPVVARNRSTWYSLRKWFKRNCLIVSEAGVLLLLVGTSMVWALSSYQHRAVAEESYELIVQIFGDSIDGTTPGDPNQHRNVTIPEMLERMTELAEPLRDVHSVTYAGMLKRVGDVALKRGEDGTAMKAYERIIELGKKEPNEPKIQRNAAQCRVSLAMCYLNNHMPRSAIELLEPFKKQELLNSGDADLYRILAMAEGKLGNLQDSLGYIEKVASMSDTELDYYMILELDIQKCHMLQRLGRYEDSQKSLDRLEETVKADESILARLLPLSGRNLYRLGRLEESRDRYNRAMAINEAQSEPWAHRTMSCQEFLLEDYLDQHNYKLALELAEKMDRVFQAAPDSTGIKGFCWRFWILKAEALAGIGMTQEAFDLLNDEGYSKSLSKSELIMYRCILATALGKLNQSKAANELIESCKASLAEVASGIPDDADTLVVLGGYIVSARKSIEGGN